MIRCCGGNIQHNWGGGCCGFDGFDAFDGFDGFNGFDGFDGFDGFEKKNSETVGRSGPDFRVLRL